MARLSWSEFRKTLKRLNRNLVLFQPRFQSDLPSMVFLYQPVSPDADKRGLVETYAVPSPTFYRHGFPEHDFQMENGKWARGYRSFFKAIIRWRDYAGNTVVKNPEVVSGKIALQDYRELKRYIRDFNLPKAHRDYRKYKHLFKPIQQAPNGGQRESSTLYSLPAR